MSREAMKPYRQLQDNGSKYFGESWDKAEQPAQQEPFGYGRIWWDAKMFVPTLPSVRDGGWIPLYTSPQPAQRTWVGMTDEEKRQLFEREDYQGWLDYINAIEAKLKEKNT